MKNVFIDDINDLAAEVYLIGYAEKGESQIFLIKKISTGSILFSCVIDCFAIEGTNKTIDTLRENNVQILDLFIWTHTDEDHSVGVDDIIDTYCGSKTNFILPEGVSGNVNDFINYNERVSATFDKINSANVARSYSVHSASVVEGCVSQLSKIVFIEKGSGLSVEFEIIGIAPMSALIRRRWEQGVVKKKNDLSIATIFKLGDLNFLFSGDIENQTIARIPDYLFENISYIKTPHHTSNSSNFLIDKIKKHHSSHKVLTTTTTTYKVHHLPNKALVLEYLKYTDKFISTGEGDSGFGVIKSVFRVDRPELIEESIAGDSEYLK